MKSYSTLRTHTLALLIGMFFSVSLAGQTIVAFAGSSGTPCIGGMLNYAIILNNPNITSSMLTDSNPGDGIVGVGACAMCTPPSFNGFYGLVVTFGSGTVGATENFTVALTDPAGFVDLTGQGTIMGTTITFVFSFVVDDVPTVAITPSTLELCDGETGNLTAVTTNSASSDGYIWSADGGNGSFSGGNPGNSPVAVAQGADTYRVTITNQCGNGNNSAMVTNNLTPSIQLDCTHNGNMTTTITADILNAATGVDVMFFNDGNLHTTSNNNNGPAGDPSITVDDATFDQQIFTATANNSCGNASISGSCLVLPIELLYFRGKPLDKSMLLEWATATELNNDFFTIERSFDGRDYKPIEIITGAGTSQEVLNYQYFDKDVTVFATARSIYYRLKQTDFDGHFSYSEVIVMEIDPQNFFDILHQNFIDQTLNVVIFNPQANPVNVQLFDLNGRLLREMNLPPQVGSSELNLAVADLKAGFYIISASNGQKRVSRKVAKLE